MGVYQYLWQWQRHFIMTYKIKKYDIIINSRTIRNDRNDDWISEFYECYLGKKV